MDEVELEGEPGPGHGVLGPRHRGVAPVQVQLREVVLVLQTRACKLT